MLLRKVIISMVVALLAGKLGALTSFDFENYTRYADSAEAAAQRFATEPVFPLFVLVANFLGLSAEMAIQTLMTLGAALCVFACISMANHGRSWSYQRTFSVVALGLPFLIFGIIVPRQGLAMGLILMAMARAYGIGRMRDLRVLALIFTAAVTHTVTAGFGALLIIAGYVERRSLVVLALTLVLCALLTLSFADPNLGWLSSSAYQQYFGNFRETGKYRIAAFVVLAVLYGVLASRRHAGVFGITAGRNLLVAQFFALACVLLYVLVGTDSVRLTYLLSLLMVADAVRRTKW